MKRFWLLALVLLCASFAMAQVGEAPSCPFTAAINVSTATTTQLVPISGNYKVQVCGIYLVALAADNVTFEYGTGASCATGTNAFTGPMPLSPSVPLSTGASINYVMKTPAGQAFCIVTSAATTAAGWITYNYVKY